MMQMIVKYLQDLHPKRQEPLRLLSHIAPELEPQLEYDVSLDERLEWDVDRLSGVGFLEHMVWWVREMLFYTGVLRLLV